MVVVAVSYARFGAADVASHLADSVVASNAAAFVVGAAECIRNMVSIQITLYSGKVRTCMQFADEVTEEELMALTS